MILCCDVATDCSIVDTGLAVPSVAISVREKIFINKSDHPSGRLEASTVNP